MKSIKRTFASLFGLATLSLATPALAGGPLAVCEPGVPYLWPNGGTDITFNPDQGNLGPVDGAYCGCPGGRRFPGVGGYPQFDSYLHGRSTCCQLMSTLRTSIRT